MKELLDLHHASLMAGGELKSSNSETSGQATWN
jgi:hypothetical protein